jgi:CBS domain-containing protein
VGKTNGVQATVAPGAHAVFYYLSQFLDIRARYDGESAPFGRLRDIGVQGQPGMPYPTASCVDVNAPKGGNVFFPWTRVVALSPDEIVIRKGNGTPGTADYWLRRDVLDDQVVDISGAKVVRVNDVHLLYAEGQLVAAHVDVGTLGILRRLGVERQVRAAMRWLFDYQFKERFVSWRHLQVIGPGGSPGGVKVAVQGNRLADMHPADLADIMEELGSMERSAVFRALDVETAAETLEEVAPDVQRVLLAQEEPGKAADILEEMTTTDAAGALRDMPESEAQRIISRMENGSAQDVRTLLAHEEESAGGMMTAACVDARANQTAAAVIEHVRASAAELEHINTIYVVDEARKLVGAVSLRQLFAAAPDATLEGLMTSNVVKVSPETSVRDVARLFVKYGFRAIPVVDEQGVFLGAVRQRSILAELAPLLRE